MTEPLSHLVRRAKDACDATAARCRRSAANAAPLAAEALESFAAQLDDRSAQCAVWLSGATAGDGEGAAGETDIREACHEHLRLCSARATRG